MKPAYTFTISSDLPVTPEAVWAFVGTMEGVNAELWPLVRMTYPKALSGLQLDAIPLGRRLFRSWLLLFGVIPFDYDDLTLIRLEPNRGFLESSQMLTQAKWEHERTLLATLHGCMIADRVTFIPRLPALGPIFLPIFKLAFQNRHRNLRRRFAK